MNMSIGPSTSKMASAIPDVFEIIPRAVQSVAKKVTTRPEVNPKPVHLDIYLQEFLDGNVAVTSSKGKTKFVPDNFIENYWM